MARITAFVFWSGVYNAGLALLLLFPSAHRSLGLNICDPLWGWLIAELSGVHQCGPHPRCA